MELNFDKIIRLKKIEIDKAELSNEEKTLKQPVLTNMEFIPEIYETYKSTIGKDYASVQKEIYLCHSVPILPFYPFM